MIAIDITVTNSSDPECQRLVLEFHSEMDTLDADEIALRITNAEDYYRRVFPKNMNYAIPFTMAIVSPVAVETETPFEPDNQDDALKLLKQAYASGQLQGTVIGTKLRQFFGVSYHDIDAEPYSDQTVSITDDDGLGGIV